MLEGVARIDQKLRVGAEHRRGVEVEVLPAATTDPEASADGDVLGQDAEQRRLGTDDHLARTIVASPQGAIEVVPLRPAEDRVELPEPALGASLDLLHALGDRQRRQHHDLRRERSGGRGLLPSGGLGGGVARRTLRIEILARRSRSQEKARGDGESKHGRSIPAPTPLSLVCIAPVCPAGTW